MNPLLEGPKGQDGADVPAPVTTTQLPSTEFREIIPDFEDSVDLRDYLEVVLRRKWLVLTVLTAAFVTTLVVSLSMKPVFMATGRLELSVRAPKVTKFQDVTDNVMTSMQTQEFIQTQVKLLQSESLANRVIDKLNLVLNPVFNPAVAKGEGDEEGVFKRMRTAVGGWVSAVKGIFRGSGDEKVVDSSLEDLRLEKSVERAFLGNLQVQPERNTTIITLSFKSTDAPLARDIVNTLIQEFIDWQMDKKIDAASSAKRQLDKQIEVARIQLEKAENNLNAFAQKAGIVSLDSKLNLVYKQLEETNNALAAAETERISKEALYKQTLSGNVSSLPMVIGNTLIQNLRQEHVKLASEYQELYTTFKDDYPRLKNLKARMSDVERKIAAEENRIADSIKNDYLAAVNKEATLKRQAEEKKALAMELNERATQYKVLEREVETSKAIHQSLLERSKEVDANVGTELGNIQVVDYATQPLTPYKPNVRMNLLLAIVVGLMGGVGLAFFLEYMDNTVKRVDELSDRFQIPVLGVLPVANPEELQDLDHLVSIKPKSSFAESIRTAKVSIQLSSAMDHPPRTLMVTSTSAGEGKTTICANLAQAFANAEEKVVIVDADLRKPRMHKVFLNGNSGNGKARGLSQLLSGLCKLEDVLQKTEVPNLFFIPAGPVPPNPAELLASSRMKRVLEKLGQHFNRVIVDAPPAAGFADVLVLGNCLDGVILVSTLGQTHREALRIFRKSLYNVRGNLLGTIINKLNITNHYGSYYYKYYKYYHYYYQPAYKTEPEAIADEGERL